MKIFVGKLSFITTDKGLAAFFASYAPIASCKIATDQHTGSSRGFAFIEIEDAQLGALAVKELHGKELDGRKIVVSEALSADDSAGKGKGSGTRPRRSNKREELGFGYRM